MKTYDQQTIDSAGVFLVGELERLDPTLNMPLVSVSWNRDIMLREDVTIADEAASFTNTSLAALGGVSTSGKNWVSSNSTVINGVSVDINKTTLPMNVWAMESSWTIIELERAMQVGRPIDSMKHEAIQLKHNMDVDEQVYVGDTDLGITGLVNNPNITPLGFSLEWTESTTPKQMLTDINDLLNEGFAKSGWAICPDSVRLPPIAFGLMTQPVSEAGSVSILEYISKNCMAFAINGRPLDIKPLKWLNERGLSGKGRAMAYTHDKKYVRFPMVPLQRTPLEPRGLHQITTHFGTIGQVEFVYPETVTYADGL